MEHDDIMQFGKHKGEKLRNVSAGWLLWWYDKQPNLDSGLAQYVKKHRDSLEKSAAEERKEYWKNKE